MKVWNDMIQGSEQWFRARAGRPSASRFSSIITSKGEDSSSWTEYAYELIAECIRPDEIAFPGNHHTDRGNELEPEARRKFEEVMGMETDQVGFITRDDEIVGCSPDMMIPRVGGGYLAGGEIKSPTAKKQIATLLANALPAEHKAQVHGSMAVTGLKFWYFVSYCPGLQPLILRIEWDEYTDKVSDALDRFLIYYQEMRAKVIPQVTEGRAA